MDIVEEALAILRNEYKAGATHEELSKRYGISSNHISNILSGKRSIESMRVGTFLKLFPKLSIGNRTIGDNNEIHEHARVQSDNIILPDQDAVENFRHRLMDLIIASDELSDEERGRVLRIIRSAK